MGALSQSRCRDELDRIVHEYADYALRLQSILESERDALSTSDSKALETVVDQKNACVRRLEKLEFERRALCRYAGFEGNEQGMQELLDWCDASVEIGGAWLDMLNCARRSRELNQLNGAVGRVRYEQMLTALAVLTGNDRAPELYAAPERGAARFTHRELARA